MSDFKFIGDGSGLSGKNPLHLFPTLVSGGNFRITGNMRQLKKFLEDGNQIFIEFTKGARAGSIGRLRFKADDTVNLYVEDKDHRYTRLQKHHWEIEWDDRENVVKVDLSCGWGAKWPTGTVLRFNCPQTVWSYKTTRHIKQPSERKSHLLNSMITLVFFSKWVNLFSIPRVSRITNIPALVIFRISPPRVPSQWNPSKPKTFITKLHQSSVQQPAQVI